MVSGNLGLPLETVDLEDQATSCRMVEYCGL